MRRVTAQRGDQSLPFTPPPPLRAASARSGQELRVVTRMRGSDRILPIALLIFFAFNLMGCATQSTLARYIVNPGKNETHALVMFKKLAQPFYS